MLLGALLRVTGTIGIWSYFLYYERAQIPVGFFGALFCAFQLLSALGGRFSSRLSRKFGEGRAWGIFLLIGISFVALSFGRGIFFLPLILLNGFLWNFMTPIIYREINHRTASSSRATVLSVSSMLGSASFAIVSPLFGKLVDATSLAAGHLFLGLIVLSCGIPLVFIIRSISHHEHRG